MNSEEVLADLKADGISNAKCITQHPAFSTVCLQKWSLKLAADIYKTKGKTKYRKLGAENRYCTVNILFLTIYSRIKLWCTTVLSSYFSYFRFLRSVSYRVFIRLIYGFLGSRRMPLPACAYTAIQNAFPVGKQGDYTGFEDESDDEM
jgi:hypothetical protein